MGASSLGSRAVIGRFYEKLEQGAAPWLDQITMRIDSDQASETYKWLGQVPQMREWIGGRNAKGFRENGITIENKTFESTIEVSVDEVRRDKTAQVMTRVSELATRAANHPVSLLSTLILNGGSGVCYDGQYFFDTDHSEGSSGTQSNAITVDLSDLPVGTDFHGSTTAPSAEELNAAILKTIQQIYGFKDDQGEPINETAKNFLVMVPVSFWQPARAAVSNGTLRNGATNLIQAEGINVSVVANPRLTWTDAFATFSLDGDTKPFIFQVEEEISISALAEGSEYEFNNNRHQYGVKGIHNVGYGMWQKACKGTLTA